MAPQASFVLRLRGGLGPGQRGDRRCVGRRTRSRGAGGDVVLVEAEGGGDSVGDAEELAMGLCNGDLGWGSRVSSSSTSGQGGGRTLPGAGAGPPLRRITGRM